MTDANENVNDSAAAAREAARANRQKRSAGGIVDYAEAVTDRDSTAAFAEANPNDIQAQESAKKAEALVNEMERIMHPIDNAPESFEAIITYGHEPLKKLGDVGNAMIKVQGQFNDQVNVMGKALDDLQQGIDITQFGEKAREAIQGLLGTAGKAGKGGFGMLKGITGSFLGKTSKKEEDQIFIDEMQKKLPEMLSGMVELVANIEQTDKGIIQVMKEAEKLGYTRVEATRELGIYLGASKEVLRRYNEEYIPQAQAAYDDSGDPEDELILTNIIKRKEDFIDHISVLEGSRLQSAIAAKQLRQIVETMEDQRKKVQDIIINSQNEWKAMLAAAGIAGSSLKAAQILEKANKFGDEVHDSTMNWIEEAGEMTRNNKSRGTVDPAKLVEASARLVAMIEKENQDRKNRLAQLEATAVTLRGATDRLLEASESSNKDRLLEASEAVKKDTAKKDAPKLESNDNDDAKPRRNRSPRP